MLATREAASQLPPLLQVVALSKHYSVRTERGLRRVVRAVQDVSLEIHHGEVLAVVGESGSGKSTLVRCLLGVEKPSGGMVLLEGADIGRLSGKRLREFRRHVQAVFQDPFSSLDPRWTARRSVREALDCLKIGKRQQRNGVVMDQLARVGLAEPLADKRPMQLSGGQRQRVAIAAALAPEPRLLIADEPVTALDVSVQAQVLNLLSKLRKEMGLAMLLVSHDLSVVSHISDRVAVMYEGRIVEVGNTPTVLREPKHPYTQALIAAIPRFGSRPHTGSISPRQEVARGSDSGCPFAPRCPHVMAKCLTENPSLEDADDKRKVACHLY